MARIDSRNRTVVVQWSVVGADVDATRRVFDALTRDGSLVPIRGAVIGRIPLGVADGFEVHAEVHLVVTDRGGGAKWHWAVSRADTVVGVGRDNLGLAFDVRQTAVDPVELVGDEEVSELDMLRVHLTQKALATIDRPRSNTLHRANRSMGESPRQAARA